MNHARFNIPTFFRIILAILVLPLFSCQNFAPESDDSGSSGGAGISKDSDSFKKKARLSVSVDNNFARTILPADLTESDIMVLELIVSGDSLRTWNSISEMTGDKSLYIEEGTYDFTLNIHKSTGLCQSGTILNKVITAGENSLSFSTSYVSDTTGSFSITVTWGADERVGEIYAGLFTLASGGTLAVSGLDLSPIAKTGNSAWYYNGSVPPGTYFIRFEVYDESLTEKINVIEDLIRILPATETTATINFTELNSLYSIEYNLGGGSWKTGYTPVTSRNACKIISLPDEESVTRNGYAFEGWFESTDGGTTLSAEAVTAIGAGTARDIVLYAKWKKATTLYVSSTGNDFNDGLSSTRALASLNAAFGKINDSTSEWTIKVSGTINCGADTELGDSVAAQSIIIEGSTSTSQDVLMGNGSQSVIALSNSVPVTIKKLCITRGGYGGINVKGSGDVTIEGSAITGCAGGHGGVYIASFSSSDVTIKTSMIGGEDAGDINSATKGGGIYKDGTGTLTISDSSIKGNQSNTTGSEDGGGGIYIAAGTVKLLEDSFVTDNTSLKNGGGIYVCEGASLIMGYANVSRNTAGSSSNSSSGGGIYNRGRIQALTSCEILSNKAFDAGGGICVDIGAQNFAITNSNISNNSAKNGGGISNLNLSSAQITLTSTTIATNIAAQNGGGIYCGSSGSFNINSGTKIITVNSAKNGGGVYNSGTVKLSGGEISGNKGLEAGGGVYNIASFTMDGGTVSENIASDCGGGVWTNSAVTLKNGTISGNTAVNFGGGILCGDNEDNPYTVTLEDFSVTKNSVTSFNASQDWLGFGGGIFIAKGAGVLMKGDSLISQNLSSRGGAGVRINDPSSSFEMQGGTISGNEADYNGGGVDVSGGSFIMSGGTISENKAGGVGGAVIHKRGTAGQSSFIISGSASIPAGEDGKNDVYMNAINPISVATSLSAESPVLKITPNSYTEGKLLLTLASGADSSLKSEFKKFSLTPDSAGGKNWYIDTKGLLKEVKAIADEYVTVSGTSFDGSATLSDSQVFIEGRALTIPNLIVGVTELSQAAYEAYCKYGKGDTDSNSPPNSNYDTGSANPIYPAYGISFYDMVVYCNLRSMAEGLTPVYSLGGETDPRDWDGIVGSEGEKYCGPSAVNSDWDGTSFDTAANGWRLPTESEWEYLARGGNLSATGQTIYSGSDTASDVGWYAGENNNNPTAVKQKSANGLGLYDMSGNVFELCWDWSDTITASTLATGAASGTRRIVRGGGCTYTSASAGVAHRGVDNTPEMRWANCGVRLVRNAD